MKNTNNAVTISGSGKISAVVCGKPYSVENDHPNYDKIIDAIVNRDWDGFIHVNPHGIHKGFVMLYNPTNQIMERKISLPLYYTGILKTAKITSKEGTIRITSLRPSKDIDLEFVISPNSYTWFLID